MIIKVCGMRDTDNIRAVAELGIDMLGFIFYPASPRFVKMISSRTGILPDYSEERLQRSKGVDTSTQTETYRPKKVGVFVDDMPQNIVTRVYNYDLDYVQLHGEESAVMIDNLRRTIVPDIRTDIKIIKTISVSSREDLKKWKDYDGLADLLLFDTKCKQHGGCGQKFDWDILHDYDGQLPFLLSGGIGPNDLERISSFRHPQCIGIDLNSKFETAPAMKDVGMLRDFILQLRANNNNA